MVYFATRSSGKLTFIADIMDGIQEKSYRVIASVESHIKNMNMEIPSNIIVTGFLPAYKAIPMAAISVIYCSQNTVIMPACPEHQL